MKKRLVYFFLGITLILSILYFMRYKRALVFENSIPHSATEVVHVNLRQIEEHVLFDALKHPLKYIDLKFSQQKKDSLQFNKMITIPKNCFLFTNNTTFKDAWFSSVLQVKDTIKLAEYLVREGFVTSTDNDVTRFDKGNFRIVTQEKRLLFIFRKNKQIIPTTTLQSIFNENRFISEQSDLLQQVVSSDSDISYATTTGDFLEVNFKDGLLDVAGTAYSGLFLNTAYEVPAESSVGHITTKIDHQHQWFKSLASEKNNKKFRELTKLSLDSILTRWDGNVTVDLKAIISTLDTIITYDYDDDFNKIEKIAVEERIVPKIDVRLGSTGTLFGYLSKKNAIQVIESDTLFTRMPLYKLYVRETATNLILSTQKDVLGYNMNRGKASTKLVAYFNIEKYLEKPLEFSFFSKKNSTLQYIKDAAFVYTANNEISVKIHLKNRERNFIGQLVKP